MKPINSNIYRSSKKEGMYLYVKDDSALEHLPEALRAQLGRLELAMTLALSPQRKLARANAETVMAALERDGYYLQLPPNECGDMLAMRNRNSKLV